MLLKDSLRTVFKQSPAENEAVFTGEVTSSWGIKGCARSLFSPFSYILNLLPVFLMAVRRGSLDSVVVLIQNLVAYMKDML